MLNLLSKVGTVLSALFLSIIPIYLEPDFEKLKDRFLTIICISFILPVIYLILTSMGIINRFSYFLPMHILFWSMILSHFLADFFERKYFFWVTLSIPISLPLFVNFLGFDIISFGSIISLVVLSEVFIYLILNGNFHTRIASIFGVISSFFGIIYLYPTSNYGNFALIISYTALSLSIWIFFIYPKEKFSLNTKQKLRKLLYIILGLFIVLFFGLFKKILSPSFSFAGFLSAMIIYSIYAEPDAFKELREILTSLFVVTSVSWLFISLFKLTFKKNIVVFNLDITLLEFMILLLINILGIKIVRDSRNEDF
ncbi:MAG: hypothetical protein ABEK17_00100 [Candidatus Aenigmatarchaeota archaeon]